MRPSGRGNFITAFQLFYYNTKKKICKSKSKEKMRNVKFFSRSGMKRVKKCQNIFEKGLDRTQTL